MNFDLAKVDLRLVQSYEDVQDFFAWLSEDRSFLGVDIETTGLNVGRDYIRLVQFGDLRKGWAFSFRDWYGIIRQALLQYRRKMVFHNCLFDLKFLKAAGIDVPQLYVHDTMIQAHLINPMRAVGLKPLSVREVDRRCAFGQGELSQAFSGGGWNWETIPIDHPSYWLYSAMDTVITAALAEKLWPLVQPYKEAYEIELGAIHVLRDAELAGLRIDLDYCAAADAKLVRELDEVLPQLDAIGINPNSEKRIVEYLLSRGATLVKKTDKGNWSVDNEVLDYWKDYIPEAGLIQRARKALKLRSAYFSNFSAMNVNGILHCNVRPCGAKTGRMSITDPALQTIPRGCTVRDGFIPRDDHKFLISDYSQMELRVMAHFAQEQAMLETFRNGGDIHDFVAISTHGENFTKKDRQICKNAQFAKIYGAGPEKFALTCKIGLDEAKAFLDKYDALFPGVVRWQQETIQSIRNNAKDKVGYVDVVGGRRIPVPVGEAFKSCNYAIQGGCAMIVKRKLIEMSNAGLHDYIRLPIHDEVICEVPDEYVEEARIIMDEVMPDRHTFDDVVIDSEAEVFNRWGDKYAADGYDRFIPEWFGEAPSVV